MLKQALPPFNDKGLDLSHDAAVGMVALLPEAAEQVHQHTHHQSCHHPLQNEG